MNQSHSRHNLFSKVDHDRSFIDKNYRGPKNGTTELPALQMDIRKKLASTHLSAKLSGKTPVVTVATGLADDQNEARFLEQFGGKGYDDDNASIVSNHSQELENIKKSPELLKMEHFMDELGKIGHVSDEESSEDSEDEYGEFVEKDRKHYKSTLDVHKKFMLKARKANSAADVKTVAAVKIMTHKKKLAQIAQNQDLSRPLTGNKDLSDTVSMKNTTSAVAAPAASTGSMLGLASAAKSFMFLSKISNAGTPSKSAAAGNFDSPASSAVNSPQLNHHKTVSIASDTPSPPAGSPSMGGSPPKYTASPGGFAYSSKHNLLHDPSLVGSAPNANAPLPLFGKANKPKQIAHRTFTATTLSTLHSKFDTTHSVLSATRDHAAVVKVAAPIGRALSPSADQKGKPLYHVPELSAVHGKKTFLGHLDRLFNSFTYQEAEPIPKPATPPPPEPLTMDKLFEGQLMHAEIPYGQKISDEELNTLLNATKGPENYGPRQPVDRTSAAAIVAELDKQLAKQRRQEEQQKRIYESIAAAHHGASAGDDDGHDQHTAAESYSMATFASPHDQAVMPFEGGKAGKFGPAKDSNFVTPPKLDLSRITSNNDKGKEKSDLKVNHGKDAYSIDVHALKLPDILSPPSDTYYQQQKQPILCIYSPPPLVGSPGQSGNGHKTSPEAPRTISPDVAAVGRGSPIQLQGTLTATAGGHAASSPAIMYISSPGLVPTSSSYSLAAGGTQGHNKSTASLPIVSNHYGAHDDNHRQHHYQTHAEYQKSLHPQTREFVHSMLSTTNPDFHTDPRNYRGDSGDSIADFEESIYDYDLEAEDRAQEPRGDRGAVNVDAESNRITLPSSAVNLGGEALLALGYQYQHSTNTYVHRDERNRSKFGQYERSPLGDPYAADFSDRHLQAIADTTTGSSTHNPVIFIPPGAPAAEPAVHKQPKASLLPLTNGTTISTAAAMLTHDPAHVNRKGKMSLSPREVIQGPNYAPVRTIMQHPHDVPLNAIHYRGEGIHDSDNESAASGNGGGDGEGENDSFRRNTGPLGIAQISADNSTLHTHNAGAEIKQEICAYIEKLAAQSRAAAQNAAVTHNSSAYTSAHDGNSTAHTADTKKVERARVKLWDKLNNRYGGDPEGEFVRKQEIKQYIYEGVKQDTQIMNEYLAEMDEGWVV